MLTPNESVLVDIIKEPILQWFYDNIAEMLVVALFVYILYKLHLIKLAKIALEYIGVKVK